MTKAEMYEKYALKLGRPITVGEVVYDIKQLTAVDVVRCKDCWYRNGTLGQPNIPCWQMHENDFCSYGERREDETD